MVVTVQLKSQCTVSALYQKYCYRILPKNNRKSIGDTHFDTESEKCRRYSHQNSRSIADAIGSDTNTAILTTLLK